MMMPYTLFFVMICLFRKVRPSRPGRPPGSEDPGLQTRTL